MLLLAYILSAAVIWARTLEVRKTGHMKRILDESRLEVYGIDESLIIIIISLIPVFNTVFAIFILFRRIFFPSSSK